MLFLWSFFSADVLDLVLVCPILEVYLPRSLRNEHAVCILEIMGSSPNLQQKRKATSQNFKHYNSLHPHPKWLSHYVTSRTVVGSRPDEVNNFHQFTSSFWLH
jgi:hypothetical protein